MSNKKQNSVEWLAQAIYEKMEMRGDGKVFQDILDQAKGMHKEEIINAWLDEAAIYDSEKQAEQYYKETFEE